VTRPGITPRRCSANSPGEAIPATMRHGRCQSRDTVPPTLVRLTHRTLERGRWNPRRGAATCSTLAQDYVVTSGQRGRSPPSPSVLCGHPRHNDTIPGTAPPSPTLWGYGTTRRSHANCCAPYNLPSAAPPNQRAGGHRTSVPYTATLQAAPGQIQGMPRRAAKSEIHQDGRLLHDTIRHTSTRR
jgi:hypothetical protein